MAMTLEEFTSQLDDSGVISAEAIAAFQNSQSPAPESAEELAKLLVKHNKVTRLQAQLVYQGKGKQLLLGNYLILDKIGAGGMGDVYLAEHRRMERRVALKTLPAAMTKDVQSIQRFHREVKAAAKLSHPNIVAAYDADEANGVHYFVMEYVEGIDLSAVVKKRGVLQVDVAVDYILQAAKGLEFAHNKGVIHRDIKPANMLLDNEGTIKILDMGLARIEDEAHEIPATQLTQDGSVMGTVDYMAPEQAKDTHTADARSDIYSLGCSLYYLLTGESVYRGSTMVNRIMAHQNDPIPSLTGKHILISQDVDAVFQKMVAKKPEDRFQSMSEVIDALDNCVQMKSASTVSTEPSDPELQKFLQSQKVASSPTVVMSADSMTAEKPLTDTQNESLTSGFLSHTLGGTSFQPLPKRKKSIGKRGWILMGAVLAPLIFIAGIVFKIDTPAGTIVLEVDQPEVAGAVVSVDDQQKITIKTGEGKEPIEVVADEKTHTLQVTKGGFETFTKQFTVKAGGKETIKVRLEPLVVAKKKVPSNGTPAKSHYALRFQNDSDHVTLPLKHETPGDLTVEAWVTIDEDSILAQNYITNTLNRRGLLLGISGLRGDEMQWVSSIANNDRYPTLETNSKVELGKRTNIAVTYKGNVAQIYVNGHKKGEMNFKGLEIHTDRSFSIGWKDIRNFKGSIDEVRFSNTARYTKDFTPKDRFESDEHTMALYHFDEGKGDVLKDSSGNGHDGKIVGAKWVKVDDELQVIEPATTENHALEFNGESNFVEIKSLTGETYLKKNTEQFTIEYWMTPDLPNSSNPTSYCVASFPFTVGLGGNNVNTAIHGGDAKSVIAYGSGSHTQLTDGRSYHIALLFSEGMQEIYINGKKQEHLLYKTQNGSTSKTTEKISLPTDVIRLKQPTGIGAGNDLSAKLNYKRFFKGIIDEVRISNTARYTKDFTPAKRFETDEHTIALYHFDEGSGDVLKDSSGNGHDGKIVGAKWVKVNDELQVVEPATTSEKPMTDHEVAEWVVSIGGTLRVNNKEDRISRLEDLPKEPFFIISISFSKNENMKDHRLRSIKELKHLEGLYIEATPVTNAGMQDLAQLTSLTKLDISSTSVGDEGLQYLAGLEKLTYLSVQATKITDVGLKHLTNLRNLTSLNLNVTMTGDQGLEYIKNLINLTVLNGGKLTTDEGLKHLSQMKQLQRISFDATRVTGSGLVHLPDPEKLVNLNLQGSPVTDENLQNVSKCTNLQVLYLRGTKITDAGLKYLESLKQLKNLTLEETKITDTGLKHLESMKRLESLNLQETKVTPQGIADLQKALPNCKIVSDFETKPATTGDSHMTDREIAEWVIGMGGAIGINGTTFYSKVEQLPTEPVKFAVIKLKEASLEDDDLAPLANMRTLKALYLDFNPLHDTGLKYLKGLDQLGTLSLPKTKITGEGLGSLKDLPSLKTLDVNRAAITNSGMKAIGDLKQLTSLNIAFNSQVDDTGLGYIEGLTKLEELYAHIVPNITDEGLKHLQGMKQLETLTLSSTGITDAGLEQLSGFKNLGTLDITNCRITDSGLEHLKELKNLRDLRLDLTPISDAGLKHLHGLKKLDDLNLQKTKVTAQGISELQKALPKCKIESDFETKPPTTKAP